MMAILKSNLFEAQNRMKLYTDRHRSERMFQVGDCVYLKLQPYRQHSIQVRRNSKLAPNYYRPFLIEEKIGTVAYRLKLPQTTNIHPVFHVSLLKKKINHRHIPSPTLRVLNDYGIYRVYPSAVFGRRLIPRENKAVPQLLMQWENYSPEEATWEDYYSMAAYFLDSIEDHRGQGSQNRGGYVTTLAGERRRVLHHPIPFKQNYQMKGYDATPNDSILDKKGQIDLRRNGVVLQKGVQSIQQLHSD